jgi:hypothetical protein
MQSTSNASAGDIRLQYAELLILAATIEHYAQLQRLNGNVRAGLSFITTYTLFDGPEIQKKNLSDPSPNPRFAPASWRGPRSKRRRTTAKAGNTNAADVPSR